MEINGKSINRKKNVVKRNFRIIGVIQKLFLMVNLASAAWLSSNGQWHVIMKNGIPLSDPLNDANGRR